MKRAQAFVLSSCVAVGGLLGTGCPTGMTPRLAVAPNLATARGNYNSRLRIMPTLADYPPANLLSAWDREYGFKGPIGIKICGTPFVMRSQSNPSKVAYGRLIVFGAHSGGRGPAGRGEYSFAMKDDVVDAISGGRMSYRYESYLTDDGQERYAWIAYVTESPLKCTCTEGDNSDCEDPYPDPSVVGGGGVALAGGGTAGGDAHAAGAGACGPLAGVFGSCTYTKSSGFSCSEFAVSMPAASSMPAICQGGNGTFAAGQGCPTTLSCCVAAGRDGKNCLDEAKDPAFAAAAKNGCTGGGGVWCPAR